MMTLRLYNTLTRQKEEFKPIDPSNVRMYVCGPTVYDFAHIGNARPVIVFDVLFRLLRHLYGENHVTYVRNITDVDDKINARALRDFPNLPLNDAIARVTEKTANQFQADVKALGCLEPTVQPRATDNIAGMIKMISTLIKNGHAYEAAGEVLFNVAAMKDYGRLSGRKLEDQQAGARVAVDAHKKNPGDFVLWKLSSADEPGWESPWGRGRPGWHIECSAMSSRYLGEVFDIHGGGLDLIFPHHENEIAQSRCCFGTDVMANVWMHNGFLQVEGQKMSKSLGNFVTISQLLETKDFGGRSWPGETLRLAMLRTHYRQPIDFTVRSLEDANAQLVTWHRFVQDRFWPRTVDPDAEMVAALKDDLNLHQALMRLNELYNAAKGDEASFEVFVSSAQLMGFLINGYFGKSGNEAPLDAASVNAKIAARLAARAAKDWKESDRIRDELDAMGVTIKDNKDGTTSWEVKR
jgi:cysteinyl-tRNA synthetase